MQKSPQDINHNSENLQNGRKCQAWQLYFFHIALKDKTIFTNLKKQQRDNRNCCLKGLFVEGSISILI